jgi:hypothetical protein
LNGDQIDFSQRAGSVMACLEGLETEAFMDVLKQVNTWNIAGQQLELFDARWQPVGEFRGESPEVMVTEIATLEQRWSNLGRRD